jgi:hypothetical protein
LTAFGAGHEAPQGPEDAITVAWGDLDAGLYGLVRVGLGEGTGSGMGLLFAGHEPVAVRAAADDVAEPSFDAVRAAGVRHETVEPLARWRVGFEDAFSLEVEALTEPVALAVKPAQGYEQLCRVRGEVQGRQVDCLGQRGHSWGRPDWEKMELARTVSAWLDDGTAVALSGVRRKGAKHHADEDVAAVVVQAGRPSPVAEPLVSTTYDGDGRQRHAGLELYVGGDDELAHRVSGDAVCGTTLDLGRLRLDTAFFRWHMAGRTGAGRYDVVRRVA